MCPICWGGSTPTVRRGARCQGGISHFIPLSPANSDQGLMAGLRRWGLRSSAAFLPPGLLCRLAILPCKLLCLLLIAVREIWAGGAAYGELGYQQFSVLVDQETFQGQTTRKAMSTTHFSHRGTCQKKPHPLHGGWVCSLTHSYQTWKVAAVLSGWTRKHPAKAHKSGEGEQVPSSQL